MFRRSASLLILSLLTPFGAHAEATFPPPVDFKGRIQIASAEPGMPIFAGSTVTVSARGLQAGQSLTLQRGPHVLTAAPIIVDAEGAASFTFELPADASTGLHPLIAILDAPSMVELVDLKVSQQFDFLGEADWQVRSIQPTKGLYQSAYSATNDALFVAGADYFTGSSELLKIAPDTLEVIARVTPADFPADQKVEKAGKSGTKLAPAGVYGLGLDEQAGRIWVTNTPDNTIAIYDQKDLSLIRQLPPGSVYHSRDVIVDAGSGHAFVSSSATSDVHVFDKETFEKKGVITIKSAERGGDFYVMSLALDTAAGELYAVSRISNELAVIDAKSLEVKRVIALEGARNATGLDIDPATGRIFIAAQDSDNMLVVDRESGKVVQNVPVGAGALNVYYDASSNLAWVASRGAGTLSAVDAEGKLVAHLDGGSYANHVTGDGKGRIFAVNKALNPQDPRGDFLRQISAAK